MVLLSSAYCPPLIYVAQFLRNEEILIEKEETYPKQTWRNRCSIYAANGRQDLIIPVSKPSGNRTKTKNILICEEDKWKLEHWRAIESAYNNSPFFLFYRDEIESLFMHPEKKLIDHNDRLLSSILELAGISAKYTFTANYFKDVTDVTDLRTELSPKKKHIFLMPEYQQVFSDRAAFIPNLSILDLLFNKGPETAAYLKEVLKLNYLT